eukprot:845776-Prymnesium_polylepis.1
MPFSLGVRMPVGYDGGHPVAYQSRGEVKTRVRSAHGRDFPRHDSTVDDALSRQPTRHTRRVPSKGGHVHA